MELISCVLFYDTIATFGEGTKEGTKTWITKAHTIGGIWIQDMADTKQYFLSPDCEV